MGYTSVTEPTNKAKSLKLIEGKKLIEASQLDFFYKSNKRLATLFANVEICDNGKIILRSAFGTFAAFE